MLTRLLVGLVDFSRRNALAVLLAGVLLAVLSGWIVSQRLGVTTDTDLMFADTLPWRQNAIAMKRDFPQFQDLLVAVVDGRTPEEVDATAAALARAAATDTGHFRSVHRPDALPFLQKNGLLLLDADQLARLLDQTIDAQPFLGKLAADPSTRGLIDALSLLGTGVTKGDVDLTPYDSAMRAFHRSMSDALDGKPRPLSWQSLLGAGLDDLAGAYRFVLLQPKLDHDVLEPGGAATTAVRGLIAELPFVRSGDVRVRLTGQVALADEEFSTVAEGAVEGMIASTIVIAFLLFLAVRSWRLILPILATLGLGLVLTFLFAALAIGKLNLVSVGFGVLFIGLADDFADQFALRFREHYLATADRAEAMSRTAATAGGQILFAALTTAAGFLAFVPTEFAGVSELGLIAGVGMLVAFVCNLTFLPAAITLCKPPGETSDVGFSWGPTLDAMVARLRWPIVAVFAIGGIAGASSITHLAFESDPLLTKNPNTEAMRTLRDLIRNPVTNPYIVDAMAANAADAAVIAARLKALPAVGSVLSINDFVPRDQGEKLALIADAGAILTPTLGALPVSSSVPSSRAPAFERATPQDIRMAATAALARIEPALAKLPADHPMADIAGDLRRLEQAPDDVLRATDAALTRFLPDQLARLRLALSAEPISLAHLPADLRRDWVLPDGRARVRAAASPEALAEIGLEGFVAQIRTVTPDATGSAVTITSASTTIVGAFRSAAIYAVIMITVILIIALRRALDVVLVLAPLLLSAMLTLLIMILVPLPLNFANIIALPLLLGVGVSFNVYTVMNWRSGMTNPLGSATTKAIVYSALTTAMAFGSVALSAHPGTASFGVLLILSLTCSLIGSLVFLPALLVCVGRPRT